MSKKIKIKRSPTKKNLGGITSIVVLGEKDHGKSTLIGRLLYATKSLPEDRIAGARSASKKIGKKFEWAHLLDSFRYEREHEMTLDTTRAIVKYKKNLYEFIDVPGHKELIKNMLTGASDAKFAILVIDILEGIKPQTLRHLEIAKFLDIKKIIVAANKIDRIGYSREKFKKAAGEFAKKIRQIGLKEKIFIIPVSASTGDNLVKRAPKLTWFKGPALLKAVHTKFHPAKKQVSARRQSRTAKIRPLCLFIEAPKNKMILESKSGEAKIKFINGFQKIHELCRISAILQKPIALENKFVIKEKSKIIAICRK